MTVATTKPAAVPTDIGKTAGELVSAGVQLIQIRTEKQLMVAVQRPRDEERFEVKLLTEAAEAGEDFYYSIPYKEHRADCKDRRNCNCPATNVEGAGVGLARSAARLWGNCSVETTIEQDLSDAWLVGAWFVDFETNYTKHETKRVSKMKFLRGGRAVIATGKDLDVVYQQGASKIERDVILRTLPRGVLERAFDTAKAAALQDKKPIKEQIARLIRRFGEIDVNLAAIERHLGHPFTEEALRKAEKDPREVLAHFRGLITAIKGGELTVADAFGEPGAGGGATVPPTSTGSHAVSIDDLEGAKGEGSAPVTGVAAPAEPAASVGQAAPSPSASDADGPLGRDLSDPEAWEALKSLADEVTKSFKGERKFFKEAPAKSDQWYACDAETSEKALGKPSVRVYDAIGKKLTITREQLAALATELQSFIRS